MELKFNCRKCIKFDSNLVCYLLSTYVNTDDIYLKLIIEMKIDSYSDTHGN